MGFIPKCICNRSKKIKLVLKHNLPDRIQVSKKIVHEEKKQEKENNKDKNQCQICLETFPQKWALKFHVTRKHNELILARQPLQKLSKERNDKHAISKLIQDKKLKVEMQFEIANSTPNMEKKRKHTIHETTFICSLCNVKIFTKKDLKAHIATVHEGTKPYLCSIRNCDSTFKTKKSLNRHINTIHERKKNFKLSRDLLMNEAPKKPAAAREWRRRVGVVVHDQCRVEGREMQALFTLSCGSVVECLFSFETLLLDGSMSLKSSFSGSKSWRR